MSDSGQQPSAPQHGDERDGRRRMPPLAVVRSIAAAAFGVQSNRNKERDFTHGNYRHFIVGGIVFTVIFVLTVAFVVSLVLEHARSP
jgi:Protein of unknown function (DUF2970)